MSIVNQMLRDLEKQKQANNQFDLQTVAASPFSLSKLIVAIFVPVLIGYIIWWLYIDTNSANTQTQVTLNEGKPSSIPLKLSDSKAPSLAVKSETPLYSSSEAKPVPPKESVAIDTQIAKVAPKNAARIADVKESSQLKRLTSMDPVNQERNLEPKDSVIAIPKTVENHSTDNSVAVPKPVKRETLASQLNRQLQRIMADQNKLGVHQTIVRLEDLVQQNPQFEKAHLSLIKLAWQIEYSALEQVLLFAVENNPEQPAFRIATARYYLQQENYLGAESIIQSTSGNKLSSPSLLQVRALIYQKQNKHQLAVNDYALLLKQTQKKAGVYLALAISLEALGEVDKAEQSYRNALREEQLNSRQIEFVKNKLLYLKG
ncbi:MAG: hypothetical protein OQK51_01055 [Kangiellaceae bacterium]|nr:hypothetical protein [Kangiellaceae bacterium]